MSDQLVAVLLHEPQDQGQGATQAEPDHADPAGAVGSPGQPGAARLQVLEDRPGPPAALSPTPSRS